MTEVFEIYKCTACDSMVEIKHKGEGKLMCCGQDMQNIMGKKEDAGKEKHLPFVILEGNIIKIQVGENMHPMEENHYIEWIEIISDEKVYNKCLRPGDNPVIELNAINANSDYIVRAYCNIHGMWEVKKEAIK